MVDSKRLGKVLGAILLLAMLTFATVAMSVAAQDEVTDDDLSMNPMDIALGGLCCIIILIPFIIGLVIAIWVYKDASKRGMSGALWLIIVILFGLLGLIIYLIVRRGHPVQPAMPPQQPGYPPQ
jgi:hypothetical protein